MRLLQVIDSLVASGGAEQAVAGMAPLLVARGVDLLVIPLSPRPGLQDRLQAAGASVLDPPSGGRAGRLRQLAHVIREVRPDLVHTTLYESDQAGRLAARYAGVPVVSSLVNLAWGRAQQPVGVPAWRVRAAWAADVATARLVCRFHALTPHVADVMARRLLVRRDLVEVIPRGRDLAQLGRRSLARRAQVRQALGLGEDTPVVLAAARQEHQKGLDVLVTAFGQVYEKEPEVHLLLAGRDGNATPALLEGIRRLGPAAQAVRLLGVRDDVPDLIAAADVVAVPSRWEGLGSTALEVLGVGTPLVASDLPAIRQTVGGPHAAFVPAGRPEQLAAALLEILGSPGPAEERALRGVEHFRRSYQLEGVVDRMVGFYERALGSARA